VSEEQWACELGMVIARPVRIATNTGWFADRALDKRPVEAHQLKLSGADTWRVLCFT
jgi:hypothetical protein